ncbi:hypothetical protein GCM10010520_68040 [Rhizobium viscosum]
MRDIKIGQTVIYGRATFRIMTSGHKTARLVEHQVDPDFCDDLLVIDLDKGGRKIDPCRGICDNAITDRDAALSDQPFGLRAGTIAKFGERTWKRDPLAGRFGLGSVAFVCFLR